MSNVFGYFVAIGSGLTCGVALVTIPTIWIIKRMTNGGGKVATRTK